MPDYQNGFGMTAEQIARDSRVKYLELYSVMRNDSGFPPASGGEWSELSPSLRAKWVRAVEVLFERMNTTFSAQAATQEFLDGIAGDGSYGRLHRILQIMWEAVLRHAITLVQAGQQPVDGPKATQHELEREFNDAQRYNWLEWVSREFRKRGAPPRR